MTTKSSKPTPLPKAAALTLLLVVAGTASAQSPNVGQTGDRACGPVDILSAGGELYSIKLDGGRHDDWQVELEARGGDRIGLNPGDVDGDTWQVLSGNFTRPESPSQVVFTLITFPDGGLYVDSGSLEDGFNFMGLARTQLVGNSPDLPGNAGVNVASGRGNTYTADLGAGPTEFPKASLSGGDLAIHVALAPVLELHDELRMGCTWGGAEPDPTTGRGLVVGYNIYRLEDDGAAEATWDEVVRHENFVYFADFFDDPGDDNSTLLDPDRLPYTGDEVVVFTDFAREPDGSDRAVGTPPEFGRDYWYAWQPVVSGSIEDFANVSLAGGPRRDYTVDVDGDGTADAVDLDPAFGNGVEFDSPQADFGIGGLGLTNAAIGTGAPRPVLWASGSDSMIALPAAGHASLEARRVREGVELLVTTGLEEAELLGFVAWRRQGAQRVRLQDELLVARGGTGNEYRFLDERPGRGGGVYEVEILTRDGAVDDVLGPVRVPAGPRRPERRR